MDAEAEAFAYYAEAVAADPALEPPELRAGFQGLRVMPVSGELPVPFHPNSGMVVLPMITAPAAIIRSTIGAVSLAGSSPAVREPRDTGWPAR